MPPPTPEQEPDACTFMQIKSSMNFTATQEVTLKKGTYSYTAYLEGGDAGSTDEFAIYVTVGDTTYQTTGTVSVWQNWYKMTIEDIVIPENAPHTPALVFLSKIPTPEYGEHWTTVFLPRLQINLYFLY